MRVLLRSLVGYPRVAPVILTCLFLIAGCGGNTSTSGTITATPTFSPGAGTNAGTVIEWNALGATLSPSTGFTGGGGPLAIDANGNVWISGKGALYELTNLGDAYPWSPFGGVAGGGSDIAIDAQSNVWIANGTGVAEFNALGQELSPVAGYVNSAFSGTIPVAIDSAGNAWLGSKNTTISSLPYALAELSNPGGQFIALSSGTGLVHAVAAQIAADSSGNIWTPTSGTNGVCEIPPFGGLGTTLLPSCFHVALRQESRDWCARTGG